MFLFLSVGIGILEVRFVIWKDLNKSTPSWWRLDRDATDAVAAEVGC